MRPKDRLNADIIWSRVPLYPVLLGLATVFVAQAEIGISLAAVLRSAVATSVLALIVILVAWAATRDIAIAGVTSGAAMILARSGGATQVLTGLLLAALCLVLVVWTGRSSRRPWRIRATRTLNGVAAALFVVGFGGSAYAEVASISSVPPPAAYDPAAGPHPDIYVVMLDAYPRADSLASVVGHSNDRFIRALAERGLVVSHDARSNYMYTAPSLVSLFDLGQMGEVGRSIRTERHALRPSDLINRSPALEVLRAAGYSTYASVARWERESLRVADHLCGTGPLNEFEVHLIRSSLLGRILDAVVPEWMAHRDRHIVDEEFSCAVAAAAAQSAEPKFVFAHIGTPHLPIIFGVDGRPAPSDVYLDPLEVPSSLRRQVDAAYADQLEYVNARTLGVLDAVLGHSDSSDVVIVMADHGSWLRIGTEYDQTSDLRERFGILFAARTPEHPDLMPMDVSIGQVFPLLFNAYLRTDIDVPESRYFFSRTEDIFAVTEIPDPFTR